MKARILLLTLYVAVLLGTVVLAFRDFGVERVSPSSILICVYISGGLITLIGGFWLAHRKDIETPFVLTLFVSNELLLILFVALWPIFGFLAIAEIFYRAASHRPKREVPDDAKRHA
jgi:succinate-acetate transporter protein